MSCWESFVESDQFSSASVAVSKRFDSVEDCADLLAEMKKNTAVKAINLSGNTHSQEACEAIAGVLVEFNNLQYADCSDMFTTRLKTAVPPALRSLSAALLQTPIQSLDVSDNALGAPGTACVVQLVPNEKFTRLSINNCGIGTAGALVLSNTFRNLSGVESIKSADVIHEDLKEILDDDPSPPFITDVRCDNIPLEILIVGRNRFKIDGAEALSYGIPYLKNLKEFHAASNSIPPAGLISILKALQNCTSLEVLDLYDNSLKAEGVSALVELLQVCPKLRKLNVGDCSLADDGSLTLVQALQKYTPNIEELDMTYNEMDNEGATAFLEAFKDSKNLTKLELNGSCISGSVLSQIQSEFDFLGSMSDNEDDEDEDDEDDGDDVDNLADNVDNLSI